MQDYKDLNVEALEEEEKQEGVETHFFCKLTFGQFFTMMVLEVLTLCFVFYLGARYGNEYLKLDVLSSSKRDAIQIVGERPTDLKLPEGVDEKELKDMARNALSGTDLKQKVDEILARQNGTAPQTPQVNTQVPNNVPANQPMVDGQVPQQPLTADMMPKNQVPSGVPPNAIVANQPVGPNNPSDMPSKDEIANSLKQQQQQLQQLSTIPNPQDAAQVAPQDAPTEVVKVKSSDASKFSVQVGSYPDVKEASYRVEEWKSRGYPAYMMVANLGDKGSWYRVRLGAFADKNEADKYMKDIAAKEGIEDAIVVKNEQ